jgi:hypothetical protein
VYWRRRLVILGVLLVVVLIVAFSCSGGDDPSKPNGAGAPATIPAPAGGSSSGPAASPGVAQPSFADSGPVQGPAKPVTPTDVPAGPVAGPVAGDGASVAADSALCTDPEMAVTPVPGVRAAKRGAPIDLQLKIKNASTRSCTRDVGADWQEIYIKQGARPVWSSDLCTVKKGSEVRQLAAGEERGYWVTWNGRDSTRCDGGMSAGPVPAAGEYEVYGRIGGVVSAPVKITIAA